MSVNAAFEVEVDHTPAILVLGSGGSLQLPTDLMSESPLHSAPNRATAQGPLSMPSKVLNSRPSIVSPGRYPWRLKASSDLCVCVCGRVISPPTCVPHRKLQRDRQTDKLPRSARLREHTLYCSSWYSRYQSAWTPVCTSSSVHLPSSLPPGLCSFSSQSVFLFSFSVALRLTRFALKSLPCLCCAHPIPLPLPLPSSFLPSLSCSFSWVQYFRLSS